MFRILRTNSKNTDFIKLVKQLDNYLKVTDGNEHDFYNQFNSIENLNHVIIVYHDDTAVSCGAFKPFNKHTVEIKRMFTLVNKRGLGFATQVLTQLETWAKEINYVACILETGKRQIEAVKFYKKNNYLEIPKYGQYKNMANSLCFKKELSS